MSYQYNSLSLSYFADVRWYFLRKLYQRYVSVMSDR